MTAVIKLQPTDVTQTIWRPILIRGARVSNTETWDFCTKSKLRNKFNGSG